MKRVWLLGLCLVMNGQATAEGGLITHVNVPLGVKVTKGQVLAEIDSMLGCLLKGGI